MPNLVLKGFGGSRSNLPTWGFGGAGTAVSLIGYTVGRLRIGASVLALDTDGMMRVKPAYLALDPNEMVKRKASVIECQ